MKIIKQCKTEPLLLEYFYYFQDIYIKYYTQFTHGLKAYIWNQSNNIHLHHGYAPPSAFLFVIGTANDSSKKRTMTV